jgi:hypothetical protein
MTFAWLAQPRAAEPTIAVSHPCWSEIRRPGLGSTPTSKVKFLKRKDSYYAMQSENTKGIQVGEP